MRAYIIVLHTLARSLQIVGDSDHDEFTFGSAGDSVATDSVPLRNVERRGPNAESGDRKQPREMIIFAET